MFSSARNYGERVFSLSQVAGSIRRTLTSRYTSSFWVRAEMIKLNYYPYSGHAFPDLIEKDGDVIVAQMRSVIWNADFRRIRERFLASGLGELRDGITILFRANIIFDEFYGLSLRIIDVDPAFTLGELERERLSCVERLKTEGLFSLNKSRPMPYLPKRFAVISVESSKGYSDFVQFVSAYAESYGVSYHLFPSLLQGEGAINTMCEVFGKINSLCDLFDAVLIVRGGGGDAGLNCYNNYSLCRAISLCPLPVLTGIGHSTNLTVAEEIAWHNGITPTDLASWIIERFRQASQSVEESVKMLQIRYSNRIAAEKERLSMSQKYIRMLSPELSLQKGFTITSQNGKTVLSVKDLKRGERISTRFFDGEIHSTIE